MDEYIERKVAKKVLAFGVGVTAANALDNVPAADVAPVIRCRNCKHRGTDKCPMYHEETVSWLNKELMPEWDVIKHDSTRDDGFCDRGEKEVNDG